MNEPWWRGTRGEWWVVLQFALLAVIVAAPATLPGLPPWPAVLYLPSRIVGGLLLAAGTLLAFTAAPRLGRNLTPLPRPRPGGDLVVEGAYRFVRHPIYSGLIAMAFGWALWRRGWLTLGLAVVLLLFFDRKSKREERWLRETYPGYDDYAKRVGRLVPFL